MHLFTPVFHLEHQEKTRYSKTKKAGGQVLGFASYSLPRGSMGMQNRASFRLTDSTSLFGIQSRRMLPTSAHHSKSIGLLMLVQLQLL